MEGPTHIKGNLLDLVLTNVDFKVLSVEDEGRLGNSDHIMLSIVIDTDISRQDSSEIGYNWRRAKFQEIKDDLRRVDWKRIMESLNRHDCWDKFKSEINRVTERYVPLKCVKKPGRPRWITREILRLLRQKREAWRKYKKEMSLKNRDEYEELSKRVKKSIKKQSQVWKET